MASRRLIVPELQAENLLRDAGQLGRVAVDVRAIAKFVSIPIVEDRNIGLDLSGMLVRDDERAVIVVNKNDSPLRKRFTVAHELGHFKMHTGRPLLLEANSPKFKLNERRTGGEVPSPHEEREANRFAAELLMPRHLIESFFDRVSLSVHDETSLVTKLAENFEVSQSAMQFRLANLGLIVMPE